MRLLEGRCHRRARSAEWSFGFRSWALPHADEVSCCGQRGAGACSTSGEALPCLQALLPQSGFAGRNRKRVGPGLVATAAASWVKLVLPPNRPGKPGYGAHATT
jgi:hypothetical protein